MIDHQRFQSSYKTLLCYCLKCRKNTESKKLKVCKEKTWKNNASIKMFSV